jgi:DNA-binding NtrC family response regulator
LKNPAALPRDHQQRLADVFGADVPGCPRLICGSVRVSAEDVAAGDLVPDFHTALSVVELRVPPLRDRLADLPRLAARLLPDVPVDAAAFDVLRKLPWPGNLRELADALGEAAAAANGGPVRAEHLPRELRVRAGIPPKAAGPKPLALDPILEAVERRLIELAMRKTGDHQTRAAELLGIFRARLGRRLEALGIARPTQP